MALHNSDREKVMVLLIGLFQKCQFCSKTDAQCYLCTTTSTQDYVKKQIMCTCAADVYYVLMQLWIIKRGTYKVHKFVIFSVCDFANQNDLSADLSKKVVLLICGRTQPSS